MNNKLSKNSKLKGLKELVFFTILIVLTSANLFRCDNVNDYNGKIVEIKNRWTNKCLKRTSVQRSRVVQGTCNMNDPNSLWRLFSLGDNKWKIMSYSTDLVMDIRDNYSGNGGVLHLWEFLNNNNQKFIFEHVELNWWKIKSVHASKCIDVPGGNSNNLLGMQQWDCLSGYHSQMFSFTPISQYVPSVFSAGAVYRIVSFKSYKCIKYNGVSQNLVQDNCNSSDEFYFRILNNHDGSVSIKPIQNMNVSTDVEGESFSNGAALKFQTFNRSSNQKLFIITAKNEDNYFIRDVNSGKCFDMTGSMNNNSQIKIYTCMNDDNMIWKFEQVNGLYPYGFNQQKWYRIKHTSNPSLCIVNSRKKGMPVIRATCNSNDNSQLWKFTYNSIDWAYTITNYLENKSLHVLNSGMENLSVVTMWETNNEFMQKWMVEVSEVGSYYLRNLNSRKCLQFPGSTDIQLVSAATYDCWDTPSQKYSFEEAAPSNFIVENKSYRIKNATSQKCLKYSGNYEYITQASCDDETIQNKWVFKKSLVDSSYLIMPYNHRNQVLDVEWPYTPNGNKVHIWDALFTSNQKFFLFGFNSDSFYIRDNNSEKCLDINSSSDSFVLQIWECIQGNLNQKFIIEQVPIRARDLLNLDGYYQIKNPHYNRCISYNMPLFATQIPCNSYDESTFWKITENSDGTFNIKNKLNNMVLDDIGYSLSNDNPFAGYPYYGQANQKFIIEFDGESLDSNIKFFFKNVHSSKCMNIKNGDTDTFAHVVQYECRKDWASQQFILQGVISSNPITNNHFYSFRNASTSQCMSYNSETQTFNEYTCDQKNKTRFKIVSSNFGSWRILSSLDENYSLSANGSNNQVTAATTSDNDYQRFFIAGYDDSKFLLKHFSSDKCLALQSGVYVLKVCSLSDTSQAFSISEALEEWANIYENGENCDN